MWSWPFTVFTAPSPGPWSSLFARDSLTSRLPLLAWLVLIEVMGLVAFPIVWRMLRTLPDRGWSVAKTLALVWLAYLAWLLQSASMFSFGPATLLAGLG